MSVIIRRVFNSAVLPQAAEIGTQQSKGITVDNYSNFWLTVGTEGMFVPPHTSSWASNFFTSSASSIVIKKGAPAGAAQANVGDGDIVVAVYDTAIAPNPGSSLSSQLRAVTSAVLANGVPTGTTTDLTLPVYSIPMMINFLIIDLVCRTAAGEGLLQVFIRDTTSGSSRQIGNLLVITAQPALITLQDIQLSAILQTSTLNNPGDAIVVRGTVVDLVGVNTYDLGMSAVTMIGS